MTINPVGVLPIVDQYYAPPSGYGLGHKPRDYQTYPMHCLSASSVLPVGRVVISPYASDKEMFDEWDALQDDDQRIKDLWVRSKMVYVGQKQTNRCWGYAPTWLMMFTYLRMGYTVRDLSPDYICTLLTNYRNEGGSGVEFIKSAAEKGVPLANLVPNGTLYFKETDAILESAGHHKITEYDDLDYRHYTLIAKYLRHNIGVTVGVPGWPRGSHEVCLTGLRKYNNKRYWEFFNPWGSAWGDAGFGLLPYGTQFDEAGAVRKVSPSLV
jgi:hypothetical protein